ncbi:isochorismatase family protein [Azotobacter vinelandii]
MELVGADRAAEQAAKLLGTFRLRDLPVIHIQHIAARAGATFFFFLAPSAQKFTNPFAPSKANRFFQKHFPNSFRETPLLDHLHGEGISQLVIAGMMTHMCVDTTIRAATDLGFSCSLAHDACATKALSFDGVQVSAEQVQISYLAALNGLFAKVISVNDLIPDIQGTLE